VYAETHATTTNPYGLVDLQIGTGTATTGQFDTIAWGAGPYYLQLAVDLTGGANYAVMGTTQMLSVPYALYAEEGSGWEKTENGITFQNGNVGIGKPNPEFKLEISADALPQQAEQIVKFSVNDATNDYFQIGNGTGNGGKFTSYLQGIRKSDAEPTLIISGITTPENDVGSSPLFIFDAKVTPNGRIQTRPLFQWKSHYETYMTMLANGNIGIGTTNPTYPLTVNGTIRSKKVIVDTGWSDFVFEDDYSLMPLHQLDKFIEKNNHLPEMPTAKEVEANGISLGEMDAKLLQKIEELTLYTIEQQKMIDKLVKDNEEMGRRIKKIERRRK
jgi:hypothetical protein